MGHRWCEDGTRNRLHCFELVAADAKLAAGAVALCGWVLEGAAAVVLAETAQWRAPEGDRSICHDCNVKWERRARA